MGEFGCFLDISITNTCKCGCLWRPIYLHFGYERYSDWLLNCIVCVAKFPPRLAWILLPCHECAEPLFKDKGGRWCYIYVRSVGRVPLTLTAFYEKECLTIDCIFFWWTLRLIFITIFQVRNVDFTWSFKIPWKMASKLKVQEKWWIVIGVAPLPLVIPVINLRGDTLGKPHFQKVLQN